MSNDEFIKVFENEYDITNEMRCIHTEIIRRADLVKIYKDCGDMGTGITFYWRNGDKINHWTYDFENTILRDAVFEKYEKMLCGDTIRTYEDRIRVVGIQSERMKIGFRLE